MPSRPTAAVAEAAPPSQLDVSGRVTDCALVAAPIFSDRRRPVLPMTVLPLNRLLADSNAAVIKRAILSASTVFGLAFATMYVAQCPATG